MYHIALFASGAGSNAQKIIEYFKGSTRVAVALVVCNKQGAGVLNIAEAASVPTLLIEREHFKNTGYVSELRSRKIDFIVLAGFLWKLPVVLIAAFPGKIINIHPALLPAYGGKGMYGAAVHEAVIGSHDKKSGISIHLVDELYDHGRVLFQATCPVSQDDTAETLAVKIHRLEHEHYPAQIEKWILGITGEKTSLV